MNVNTKTLEEYGALTGFHIYCIDNDPSELIQGFDDLSTFEKYVISDDKYNERENTFRAFKKKALAENPNAFKKKAGPVPDYQKEEASNIDINDRCKTIVGDKRGTVMFVGKVPECNLGAGYWVGIKLDEKEGNSNGSMGLHIYFEAEEGYAIFVRPLDIIIGDFPPELVLDEDEDMI